MRSILHRAIPSLLVPLVAACAGPSPVGEAEQPIIGGTMDPGDPAVVLLASYPPDLSVLDTCTAVAVSGTVLLTAAHCVDMPNHPNYVYGIFPGPDASAYATLKDLQPHLLPVSAVYPHPSYDPNPPYNADIGVVVAAAPMPATPFPYNRTPLDASIVGQPARIIGYGQVVYGTYNVTKNTANTVVASLGTDDTVAVGDAVARSCLGDSGSPALATLGGVEKIIGVDSYTNTTGCMEPASYRRTDLYTAFIDPFLSAPDGGTIDAGPEVDAGPGPDAGAGMDAGPEPDAGAGMDAGTHPGGGGGPTTNPEPPPSSGCTCSLAAENEPGGAAALLIALASMARRRRKPASLPC